MAAIPGIGDDAPQADIDLAGDVRHHAGQGVAVIRIVGHGGDIGEADQGSVKGARSPVNGAFQGLSLYSFLVILKTVR